MRALKLFLEAARTFAQNPSPKRHFGKLVLSKLSDNDNEGAIQTFTNSYDQGLFFVRFLASGNNSAGWKTGLVTQIKLSQESLTLFVYDGHGGHEYVLELANLPELFVVPAKPETFMIIDHKLVKTKNSENPQDTKGSDPSCNRH